jgi:hypothetical protein
MSKRLQVVVADAELAEYERTAAAAGLTLSEWVRQSLRSVQREESSGRIDEKLETIRQAAQYSFPAPGIETLLAEIDQARAAGS